MDATLQQQKPVEQRVTGQTANSPIIEEVNILKEELEKLKDKIAGELGKQISDQGSVIDNLEENVRGLKRKLDESKGELENEVTFTFELKGIDALLAAGSKKANRSELFFCRGEFGIGW